MADLPESDTILSALDLEYCPLHGKKLETESPPARCPDCGPVNIDFWRTDWED